MWDLNKKAKIKLHLPYTHGANLVMRNRQIGHIIRLESIDLTYKLKYKKMKTSLNIIDFLVHY